MKNNRHDENPSSLTSPNHKKKVSSKLNSKQYCAVGNGRSTDRRTHELKPIIKRKQRQNASKRQADEQ
jgi:hypothetical protein